MKNLYWLAKQMETIILNAVNEETGEIEIPEDVISALQMDIDEAREQAALAIKNLKAENLGISDEQKRLEKRKANNEKIIATLEANLSGSLNGERFRTAKCDIVSRRVKSVETDADFIEWAEKTNNQKLLRYKTPEANRVAIKALLNEGVALDKARLVERFSLTIK